MAYKDLRAPQKCKPALCSLMKFLPYATSTLQPPHTPQNSLFKQKYYVLITLCMHCLYEHLRNSSTDLAQYCRLPVSARVSQECKATADWSFLNDTHFHKHKRGWKTSTDTLFVAMYVDTCEDNIPCITDTFHQYHTIVGLKPTCTYLATKYTAAPAAIVTPQKICK